MRWRGLFVFVVAIVSVSTLACRRKPELAKYRDVAPLILISIDTLRADHLPAYGYDGVETPEIDRFLKEAVLFERCYAHCPQTLPSHASILTGQLPFEHGVRDNIGFYLKKDQPTLAGILAQAGFEAAGFISSYVLRADTGISQGFETYDAQMKREKAEISMGELQRPGSDTIEAARSWLAALRNRQPARRFFLFLHLYEPHTPYDPPEPYRSTYASRLYDGEIAYTDSLVGSFLQTLRDMDVYDKALIILTSDHGEGLGSHGEQEHGVFIYNETIHVPLMIKFPAGDYAGRKVEPPVQHIDLVPTLLGFYGVGAGGSFRGTSLVPLLAGSTLHRAVYSESLYPLYHFGWSELFSLTDDTYKFIKAPREELYDLRQDPTESRNLASSATSTAAEYRRRVDEVVGSRTAEAPAEISPDELEKLQALGYIGIAPTASQVQGARPDPKDKIQYIEKFRKGLHLHRTGDEEAAVAIFREILDHNPDMADVLEQLGRSLVRLKRQEEALEVLRRAAVLRNDNPLQLMAVARMLWKLKHGEEARVHLDRALELNPALARAQELRGQILYSEGKAQLAVAAFDRALAIDASLPMPYYVKGLVSLQRGDLDGALTLLRRAAAELSKRESQLVLPGLHSSIGFVLARKGETEEAIREYNLEIGRLPSNAAARIQLAQLLIAAGRRDEALRLFDEPPRSMAPEGTAAMIGFLRSIGENQRADRVAAAARGHS